MFTTHDERGNAVIPALATIVAVYCVARLLLELRGVVHAETPLENWAAMGRLLVIGGAILVIALHWWAIQNAAMQPSDLPSFTP